MAAHVPAPQRTIHPLAWMPVAERFADRPWDAAIAIAVYRIGQRRLDGTPPVMTRDLRNYARDVGLGEVVIVPAASVIRYDHSRRIPVMRFLKEVVDRTTPAFRQADWIRHHWGGSP